MTGTLERRLTEEIVTAARTSVGDTLRSVTHFTPAAFDVVYLREDLTDSRENHRSDVEKLVELERVGFAEAPVRTAVSGPVRRSGVGSYEFTVRFHGEGFVVRVIEGESGVLLTADGMNANAFREAATAIRQLLAGRGA